MMDYKRIEDMLDKMTKKEIKKLRELNNQNSIDDHFYQISKKIFTRLVFPYFRFEIMQRCIVDIKDNIESYPNITNEQRKKIDTIFEKLQKICVYLNAALDEYYTMLSDIEMI